MKRIQYEIEYDSENNLIIVYTTTKLGHSFNFAFDKTRTIDQIINKMEPISNQLNSDKFE